MTTTIIAALETYLKTYGSLKSGAPVLTEFMGKNPTQYSVVPQGGEPVVEWNIDDSSEREYAFAFQSVESTADDLNRMANDGFFEAIGDWFDSQTHAGIMPTLNTNQHPFAIRVTGRGVMWEQSESTTGTYQILCKLIYDQDEP